MESHIQKWGNSLGIRIPMQLAKKLNLYSGSAVNLEVEDNRLIIQAPHYDLEKMLGEITPNNQHHQILEDGQMGNEEW